MSKRNFTIILCVLVSILIVVVAKGIVNSNKKQTDATRQLNLESEYKKIKDSKKPSMIVFSYDADCCENTRKFFDEYNRKAEKLMNEYKTRFNVLFINTGILDDSQGEVLEQIAVENKVSRLPSILLTDSQGKPYKVIEGAFDEAEIRKDIDGMVKQ